MAEYIIQGDTLTGIANAIRSKTGSSSAISVANMASAINDISTGSGSSGGTTVSSNVETGEIFIENESSQVSYNGTFKPSKLIIYGAGTDNIDNRVVAFIYDSSKTNDISILVYNTDYSSESEVNNWTIPFDESDDDPQAWVTKSGNSIIAGISNTIGAKFGTGTWNYIAIA